MVGGRQDVGGAVSGGDRGGTVAGGEDREPGEEERVEVRSNGKEAGVVGEKRCEAESMDLAGGMLRNGRWLGRGGERGDERGRRQGRGEVGREESNGKEGRGGGRRGERSRTGKEAGAGGGGERGVERATRAHPAWPHAPGPRTPTGSAGSLTGSRARGCRTP